MAEKKSIFKASAKKSTPKEIKPKSDKELVLDKYSDAECFECRIGKFHICINPGDSAPTPIHSGLCKSESDAWKLAAHSL